MKKKMQHNTPIVFSHALEQCQCCLSKENLKIMTQPVYFSDNIEIYYEMLTKCFSVEILTFKKSDEKLLHICEECIPKLRDCYSFRSQVEYAQNHFQYDFTTSAKSTLVTEVKIEYKDGVKKEADQLPDSASMSSKSSLKDNLLLDDQILSANHVNKLKKMNRAKGKIKKRSNVAITETNVVNEEEHKEIENKVEENSSLELSNNAIEDDGIKRLQSDNERDFECDSLPSPASSNDSFVENVQEFFKKEASKTKKKKIPSKPTRKKKIFTEEALVKKRAYEKKKRSELKPFKITDTDVICPVCSKDCLTNRSLATHMNVHYPKYVCEQCGKAFVLQATLKLHIKSHEEGVTCSICNKKLFKTTLRVHMLRHLGKKDFHPCPLCDLRFESTYKRAAHMEKIHNIIKRYNCQTCGKVFDMSYKYRTHLRTHNPHFQPSINAVYECDQCHKVFPSKCHLTNHSNVHKTDRNFQCHLCPKNYKVKHLLTRHLKEHDDDSEKYLCSVCNRAFVVKHLLKRHMMRVHKIKIELNSIQPTVHGRLK